MFPVLLLKKNYPQPVDSSWKKGWDKTLMMDEMTSQIHSSVQKSYRKGTEEVVQKRHRRG